VNWRIEESPSIEKQLHKVPSQVALKYQFWLDLIRYHGPEAIVRWRGFRDEKLRGNWTGYRSSRLNRQYRVIYRVEYETLSVCVEKLDAHTYG
jgi:addiction module RelE/StbE family toxin